MSRNKSASAIALFLILSVAAFSTCLPIVKAEDIPTYAFITASPNPVGVTQRVQITAWIDKMPPFRDMSLGSWSAYYSDITIEVTAPDGSKQTLGPQKSDPVGTTYFAYTPKDVGTYYFQMIYPGEDFTPGYGSSGNDVSGYYLASTSKKLEVTVQEEPIQFMPAIPIPTGYWQRPIFGENYQWASMAGNWLGNPIREGYYNISGNFNPYTTAPNTAHVVWTTQQEFGGITGGDTDKAYYEGIAYEMRFRPPVIISGRLYLDLPLGHAQQGGGTVCLDLRTGKQIWWQNITIQMGQLYDYESPNQEGFHAYLWDLQAPTYKMYDAYSGELLTTFTNAVDASAYRRGAVMTGPHGELIIYHFNVAGGYMTMWNSSAAFPELYRGATGTNAWQWRPQGKTVDWSRGVQMNVTVPIAESYGPWGLTLLGHSNNDDILTMEAATKHELVFFGFDAHTLQQLWTFNLTTAVSRLIGWNISPLRDGVFCVYLQEKKETYGYNAYTGQKLWGPTEPYENDWAMFYQSYAGGGPFSPAIAYGKLYATSYDGMVHCHDLQTGEELWTYSTGNSGLETPYGTWPFYGAPTIADDKLFVSTNEHSINNPIYRGERLHCINATTGEGIWNISAVMPGSIVADGYLVGLNYYDSLIYCFGKGQTATTISASPDVSVYGDTVLIKGTVTDQSPGETCLGIPTAGTPAIADEYMTPWMEYLYEQKPMPQDVKGVEVVLETLDPNNNFYEIGRTTSDANGMYSFMFTPEVPGKYTIMATFKGSESYFSSSTETAIGVTEAPQSTPTPPPPAPSMADIYFMPMSIGLIIAIVAVGLVIILMLRKR